MQQGPRDRSHSAATSAGIALRLELVTPSAASGSGVACSQPVSIGLPFGRGACADLDRLHLRGTDGSVRPLQVRPLERWPDESVRWALVSFQSDGASPVYWLGMVRTSTATLTPCA